MFKTKQQNNTNKQKGFTLVEMIVSIALFSIVVVVAIGGILTIIDANRKSQTLTLVMNNLNFALEIMTRNIKTADPATIISGTGTFNISGESETSIDFFELEDQDGNLIKYFYYSDDDRPGSIYKVTILEGESFNNIAYPIISDEVIIEEFDFVVNDDSSDYQPSIFLKIEGYAEITERIRSDFNIQTTVSPRRLDITSI